MGRIFLFDLILKHDKHRKLWFLSKRIIYMGYQKYQILSSNHEQPQYILISEPGQPFRTQFVLYRTDNQIINRTSWCNKVEVVRLYALYRLNLLLLAPVRMCMVSCVWFDMCPFNLKQYRPISHSKKFSKLPVKLFICISNTLI